MMRSRFGLVALVSSGLLGLVVAGCRSSSDQGSANAASQPAAALPADLILKEPPDGALDVTAAKQLAQPGESVVMRGRIGGRVEPFVENRAVFQLVDLSVPTCADNSGDGCKTPWDYCCEPKDQITAKSATIQITGADGKPLPVSVKGQEGLSPMAKVVVRGKVSAKPNDAVLIVDADGIYVIQ